MLHVITGGSGSGKSAYAENWLLEQREKNLYDENSENTNPSAPLYIATMIPYGKEGETKVIRHRETAAREKDSGHLNVTGILRKQTFR